MSSTTAAERTRASVPTPLRGRFITVPTLSTGAATTDRAGGGAAGTAGKVPELRTAASA
jgi:hypothetical protein